MMACTFSLVTVLIISLFCFQFITPELLDESVKKGKNWKKKDIRDYSDADMERLFDQWEDADDPLPEDELPEWKQKPKVVELDKLDPSDPEGVLKMTKKGKTLMMFASVSGNPSEKETEQISKLWQGSLFNANIDTQRFVVGQDRVIFSLKDGAMAWEVKNYLVQQDRCSEVTIDGKSYPGKGGDNKEEKSDGKKDGKKSDKDTNKSKKSSKSDNKDKSKDKNKTKSKQTNKDSDNKTKQKKTEL